jgi:AraC-like DNA-binding protein
MKIDLSEVKPAPAHCNLFRCASGQSWGPREIPDFELIYIFSGFFSYRTEKKEYVCSPGNVLCVYPGIPHTLRHIEHSKGIPVISCIHLELLPGKRFLKGDYSIEIEPEIIIETGKDSDIPVLFKKCRDLFENRYSKYSDLLISTVIKELWIRLFEYWENGGTSPLSERTSRILRFINENITSKISRSDIAEKFKLTPEYVNEIFRKELVTTPVRYINGQRVNLAYYHLVQNGCSVKEAALLSGFDDEFYFSKVFKKIKGFSPSEATGRKKPVKIS